MTEIGGYILIIIGILFDIFGCIGLVRFPDVYNRLQASTKCVTLGTILLLFGVAL
ncbi:MAG: monovalent cation/H(+) antiporter subunit G, partial [Planctomycetota bacterium]